MTVKRAFENFRIPSKTLERSLKNNNLKKWLGWCQTPRLDKKMKESLSIILFTKIQKRGFSLTIHDIWGISFRYAEQFNLMQRFNKDTEKAGYDCFNLFIRTKSIYRKGRKSKSNYILQFRGRICTASSYI